MNANILMLGLLLYARWMVYETAATGQNPASFKCTKDSPVGPPVWSTNKPQVEMRHIFCGHIVGGQAQGLHSLSTVTNWQACAIDSTLCKYFADGNGYCPKMWIYNSQLSSRSFVAKSDTTLWPAALPPAVIVPALQNLYNSCMAPPITNAKITLCFPECRYAPESQYKNHRFDIVIISERKSIISAYPATRGTCLKHQNWRQCASKYCQFRN